MLTSKGQTKRDEILKVAREILSESGYDSVSLRDIASRLDIKLGNLQYYFSTRENLFVALIEREGERDIEIIRSHLAARDDPREAFNLIAQELLRRWRGESAMVYLLMHVLRTHRPAFEDLYKKTYRRHYEAFSELIEQMRPELSESEILRKAQIVTSMLDGALLQMVSPSQKDSFNADIVREARELIQR
ncbi:MAG: TetR/AcrR family transcriptional regulator [Pseudomonadota bacterium]